MDDAYSRLREQWAYCVVCGSTDGPLEAHHVLFRSRGGATDESNLILLCPSCHRKRHDELIDISVRDGMLVVVDKTTGEISTKPLVPHVAAASSSLVEEARAVGNWLGLMLYGDRLRSEPDEVLATLYDELRALKHKLWMVQAAIINEFQSRSSYGDGMAKHVAAALGCSERTVQSRGQIYREIIAQPECRHVCEDLHEEAFYKEAVSTDNPVLWINYAHERKVGDPRYTLAQFREEIRSGQELVTITRIILEYDGDSTANTRIAERLETTYGVPVVLRDSHVPVGEDSLYVEASPSVGSTGRALGAVEVPPYLAEAVAL